MDPHLQLPPDYYEKMKLELNQRREEEKRIHEQQPSTSERSEEKTIEIQQKITKQEPPIDTQSIKREIDGDRHIDSRKHIEKESSKYDEKNRSKWDDGPRKVCICICESI